MQLIFGNKVPPWIWTLVGWVLLIGILLCALWGILFVISKIKEIWVQNFQPLFYNQDEKRCSVRRRTFAEHIEYEITQLGRLEDWKDYRFTELEAEVEAEGRRRILGLIPFFTLTENSLRREQSLSKALASSQERLILVEGEPGSGKSVALRHVALAMAKRAAASHNIKSVIPIYVNLKEMERPKDSAIDRNLIESFILKSLKRANDRDVEQFLDNEFDAGLKDNIWFFLFDSFDELPDVLSSTESDTIVRQYGDAIDDFLHGMNRCRGVVASRQFRGPVYFGWPSFRILSLSDKRRYNLIHKMRLKRELEIEIIGQLGLANQEIRAMTSNPLFLTLLCEHMKSGHLFPENTYTVFETYIESRLTRDETRIQRRFQLDAKQLRKAAEQIAFCMATDTGLGLSPTRDHLKEALYRLGMSQDTNWYILLDALEYIKLARSDSGTHSTPDAAFTFAHRRFQEYFATSVVLREPERITPRHLLTNARWRETAVVLCQTQPIDKLTVLLRDADQLLIHYCNNIPDVIDDPREYVLDEGQSAVAQNISVPPNFSWPSGAYHVLGLLQDGFSRRLKDISENTSLLIGKVVLSASVQGTTVDRKWALEVAGLAPEPILKYLLANAFASKSQWLKEVAYRQVARLSTISSDVAQGIRNAIIELAATGCLYKERHATRAYLARCNQSADFLTIMKLLLWLPYISFCLYIFLFTILLFVSIHEYHFDPRIVILIGSLCFFSYIADTIYSWRNSPLLQYFSTVVIVVIFFWPQNSFIYISLLIAFVHFYKFFAIKAAKFDAYTAYIWWPFLAAWPLIYAIGYIIRHPERIRKNTENIRSYILHIRKKGITNLLKENYRFMIFISFMVCVILAYFERDYIKKYYPLIYTILSILTYIAVFAIISFIAIIIISLLYIFINYIYHIRCDSILYRKHDEYSQKSITIQDLFQKIALYHNKKYQLELINSVQERHALIITKEAEIFLKDIIYQAEGEKRLFLDVAIPKATRIKKNHRSLKQNTIENDPGLLDGFYKLLDYIMRSN